MLELALDLPFGDRRMNANYTWSNSKVVRGRNAGQPFHNPPRHMLNLGFDWAAGERLGLWGQGRWRSRSATVPQHAILDLGMAWDFSETVKGTLAIYNFTDKAREDVLP
ncbi:TonB-dependent receptor domain-containing protein [Pseudogemmobacter sonorensis]|uniref:TonB-dependent receptor domain-containing protein n=1 Tax=Pseudogemmobacter sonorensis TaxID=2989681 RepID=UPI0036C6BA70